jgi:hypothetical protein
MSPPPTKLGIDAASIHDAALRAATLSRVIRGHADMRQLTAGGSRIVSASDTARSAASAAGNR